MKTVFDKTTREELMSRINTLDESKAAEWGKMNAYQVLKHCSSWEEWVHGRNNTVYKRSFMGLLFGRWVLKSMTKDDEPLRRSTPTSPQFVITETSGEIEPFKRKWIALIEEYARFSNPNFVHDFFGKMTPEQIGILAYKHTDHHLRQFGC